MHFVLQVAHIIEKGVSQFKRTERYSDYVYECSHNMDVDSGIQRNKTLNLYIFDKGNQNDKFQLILLTIYLSKP